MTVFQVLQHALNVGVVDEDKLHRVDLERMRLAAQQQTNWQCDTVGKMYLRPGTSFIALTAGLNKAKLINFIAAQSAAYVLELTDSTLRVMFNDILLQRPFVNCTVQSGTFAGSTGWTFATAAGQTSQVSGGFLQLSARGRGATAFAKQTVTTASPGLEHALRIIVPLGDVGFRIGTADGLDDLVPFTTLDKGTHSLAFIPPSTSFFIQFSTQLRFVVYVDQCQIEAPGVVTLPTIWPVSALGTIRRVQSLDVMYLAALGFRPQKIERRGQGAAAGHSWSVTDYRVEDGPFLAVASSNAKLTPGALDGNTTLTSDVPLFKAAHVGALFRLYHDGQAVDAYVAAESQFTPAIQVTGVNETNINERFFVYTITGTWAGTIKNQRSFDGDDIDFHDYRDKQTSTNINITSNVTSNVNDDDEDNAITWYRIGFAPGLYTSGEAHIVISYNGGGGFGVGRVISYVSPTVVNVEVLSPFAGTTSTQNWLEGSWSDVQGYPGAVGLDDGRLVWPGSDKWWASISDAYQSMDIDFVGDAGPIDRAIALGGRNESRWVVSTAIAVLGTDARVARAGASALMETVTPDNFTIRNLGNVGAAEVDPALLIDNSLLFVEASGTAVYEMDYQPYRSPDFQVTEFSKLSKELFDGGVTEVTVSTRPDQRVHMCIAGGDAVTIVHEPSQQVTAFIPISTSYATDVIESQCVVPGNGIFQDIVYRSVSRLVNGAQVRMIEKVALDNEAKPTASGGKVMDAGVTFGAGSMSIGGLSHLIGRTVVVWMDGAPLVDPAITDESLDNAMQFVVSGAGTITLPRAPTIGGFVGLPYVARYQSARLAYGVGQSSPVLQMMSIASLGLLLADFCRSGVRFGTEFDNPDHPLLSLPHLDARGAVAPEVVNGVNPDELPFPVDGGISLDARVCIEARSPKPAAVLALTLGIQR